MNQSVNAPNARQEHIAAKRSKTVADDDDNLLACRETTLKPKNVWTTKNTEETEKETKN